MNRDDAFALLVETELGRLTTEERRGFLETAIGEGLLDEQPDLVGGIDDAESSSVDSVFRDILCQKYLGTTNEYIAECLRVLGCGDIAVVGYPEPMEACPCCRCLAIPRRGEYDVCPVCGWEDTGSDDPDVYSGPNHETLGDARSRFAAKEANLENGEWRCRYLRTS